MKRKQIIKTILFICLVLLVYAGLTKLFIPKWIVGTSSTYVTEGLYEEKKDTIDVCFIGSSQLVYGVSSMRLLEKYGISAYSCATGEQPLICSYFYLKELRKKQNYSTVVLDCSMLFEKEMDTRFRNTIDSAPWSLNKLQTIKSYCDSNESADIFTYLFPIINYHSRWDELKVQDVKYRSMNHEIFKGNNLSSSVNREFTLADFSVDHDLISDDINMEESQLYWFDKVASYCKENNIDLILVKTPKNTWNKTMMLKTEELAEKYGLPYYDFNTTEMLQNMNFIPNEDMWNREHFNVKGTDKFTDYLAENYLSKYIDDSKAKLQSYDQKLVNKYILSHDMKYMRATYSIEEMLQLLKNDNYDIFVVKSGDISDLWTESIQKQWGELGASTDMRLLNGSNYIAHLSANKLIDERVSLDSVDYEHQFMNGSKILLKSVQTGADIKYDDKPVKFGNNGLNIFVYDHTNNIIVDRFTIFYNANTQALDIVQMNENTEEG